MVNFLPHADRKVSCTLPSGVIFPVTSQWGGGGGGGGGASIQVLPASVATGQGLIPPTHL